VPGAHQTAVFVDAAAGEVGTQVAALATDSEVIAIVAHGVLLDSGDRSFGDTRSWDGMTHKGSLMADDPTVAVRIRVSDVATMSWMTSQANRAITSDGARAVLSAFDPSSGSVAVG
jgi:hypothetical protein